MIGDQRGVSGTGLRVKKLRIQDLRLRVKSCSGYKVEGQELRVQDTRLRVKS